MTFLQLSTYYPSTGVSFFASGTGAAGILGAGAWWFLRSLGVKRGVGISSVCTFSSTWSLISLISTLQLLPLVIPLTYWFLLPPIPLKTVGNGPIERGYSTLPTDESLNTEDISEITYIEEVEPQTPLTLKEKWILVKPLLLKFMLPLCACIVLTSSTQALIENYSPSIHVRIYHKPRYKSYPRIPTTHQHAYPSLDNHLNKGLLSSLAGEYASLCSWYETDNIRM